MMGTSDGSTGADIGGSAMARKIRFMFEWGHRWPLWESGTDSYTMEPEDYGLSPELTDRLQTVYEHWQKHLDTESGWDSPENETAWIAAARQVLALLRREVADFAEVLDESGIDDPS